MQRFARVVLFIASLCVSVSALFHSRSNSTHGYKVLVDAGSTGSRVYIYKYDKSSPWKSVNELAHKRLHPALSSFVHDFAGLEKQMEIFLRFAKYYIEEEEWSSTDVALKATAGLRSISAESQEWLIDNVRSIFRTSGFRYDPTDTRVISGQEEAMYGLLAVNAAFLDTHDLFSIGAADLGGSSTQISFLVPPAVPINSSGAYSFKRDKNFSYEERSGSDLELRCAMAQHCQVDYELSLDLALSGHGAPQAKSGIFARSVSGLGLIAAMEEVIDTLLNMADGTLDTALDLDGDTQETVLTAAEVEAATATCSGDDGEVCASEIDVYRAPYRVNPCLAPGTPFPYLQGEAEVHLLGSGNFSECVALVEALLRRHADKEASCMRHLRPKLIVGMDNLPKVLEIMNLANEVHVSPRDVRAAGEAICQRAWTDILLDFPTFMPYRAQRACFGASYVYSLLRYVYNLDEEDNTTFLPLETHHDYTLGWPLGAALFSAIGLDASHLDVGSSVSGVSLM